PRAGEQNGREYHFVQPEEFQRMIQRRELLEYAEVFGHYYGSHRDALEEAARQGSDLLLDIDVQGAQQVKERLPDAVAVFVLPPSWQELEHRLRARGLDAPEAVQRRLRCAREEIELSPDIYDYLVVNRSLEETCAQVQAIVVAERARRSGQESPPPAAALAAAARKDATKSQVSAILETFGAHGA
ncbi:MAG TPA: guanylate kinase, partial [Candidatus Acidoferrales bacterium]|nr:guanylate kinase [Candidatus Acidoferrales bacterium]